MLVRLMYVSRAAQPLTPESLAAIQKQSRACNPEHGITGVLCHSGDIFLQVLEGGRNAVSTLYNHIVADPRHTDVVLLSYEDICERSFASWTMGQVNLSRLNPGLLLKYSETPTFNPYAVSGSASMALLTELVATASIAGQGG